MSVNMNTSGISSRIPFENSTQRSIYRSISKCPTCGENPNKYRMLPLLIDLSHRTNKIAWKILNENPDEVFKPRTHAIQARLEKDPRLGLGKWSNQLLGLKLSECACKLFDRFRSHVRNVYENYFVEHAMKKIKWQLAEKGFFDLNITLFMPGKLGAEVILLGSLMKAVKGFPGCLNISLIEPEYSGILCTGKAKNESFQLALIDFRKMLYAMSLQTGVEISPVVCYESEQDYKSAVKHNSSLSYDFFLGSDLGKIKPYSSSFIALANETRNKDGGDAIILYGDKCADREKVFLWHNEKECSID